MASAHAHSSCILFVAKIVEIGDTSSVYLLVVSCCTSDPVRTLSYYKLLVGTRQSLSVRWTFCLR